MITVVPVLLPCGCGVDGDLAEGVELGVELMPCVGQGHDVDAGPFLVTWRQLVAVTVTTLEVPEIAPGPDVVTHVPVPVDGRTVEPLAPPEAIDLTPFTERPLQPGDVTSSPRSLEEWRAEADARGLTAAALLQRVRQIADHHNLTVPRALGEEDIDEVLTPLVLEWLDHHHPAKGDG